MHRLQSRWAAGAAEAESANGDASAPSPSGGGTLPRPVLTPRAANPDPRSPCFALEMSRDRRDDDCVYFLLHIPKTAGQTLQQHFARHCAPGAFWQTTCRVKLTPGRRAAALPDPGRARVIAGHQLTRAFAGLFFGREIRPIVLLRDPLELQISLYNWQMMNNIAIGLGTYSFALHLRAQPVNFIAHFLLTRWLEVPRRTLWLMSDEAKYEAINRAFAGFWFVGAHRDCDRLIATLAPALGVPPTAPRRNTSAELQAQTGWPLLTAASLSSAECDRFRDANRVDQALWENWRSAGYAAAAVKPAPLPRARKAGAAGHEMRRPWFKLRRAAARRRAAWRFPVGAGLARLAAADRARDAEQWEAAALLYRRALRLLPRAPALWVQYGHALKHTGNLAQAENAYRQALRYGPPAADTYLQLGHALKLQGRLDDARAAYRRSLMLDPAGSGSAGAELAALGEDL